MKLDNFAFRVFMMVFLLMLVVLNGGSQVAARPEPPYLTELAKDLGGGEATSCIVGHLAQTAPSDPLAELVNWAAAGFPDLHDEHGIWKVTPDFVQMGVVHSIHYFLRALPEPGRAKRYFAIMDTLCRGDGTDYWTWQLAGSANRSVVPELLKSEAIKRMSSEKEAERCQGILMATGLANDPQILARFRGLLSHDDSRNVRVTVLYSMGSLSKRDAAVFSLDRLLNDPLKEVRELAANCLKIANQSQTGFTTNDIHIILFPMVETQDPFVRVTLGQVAARISTGVSLMIDEQKLDDEILMGFTSKMQRENLHADNQQDRNKLVSSWRNGGAQNARITQSRGHRRLSDHHDDRLPPQVICERQESWNMFLSEIRLVHFTGICGTAKAAALNFLKGQVMKLSKGNANPALAEEILERKLKS